MTNPSPIEQKIKEAYLEGAKQARAEQETTLSIMESTAEQEAQIKAQELWVSDEEIEKDVAENRKKICPIPCDPRPLMSAAKFQRDRLFNAKNDTP